MACLASIYFAAESFGLGGGKVNIPACFAIVFVLSAVIMYGMVHHCGNGRSDYWKRDGKATFVFVVDCISLGLCLLWVIFYCVKSEWSTKTVPMLAGLLAILWFFGAFIGTTWVAEMLGGNEYFAGWLCAYFSIQAAYAMAFPIRGARAQQTVLSRMASIQEFRAAANKVTSMARYLEVCICW